ncbi:MAG: GDSL-type esterase/lipase family protein [Opitutia bacterium]
MERLLAILLLGLLSGCASYRDLASEPLRMSQDIAGFEEADRVSPPPADALLLSGASTMRLWKSAPQDFAPMPLINRGFGGSYTTEVLGYMERITLPYHPRVVVLHCGSNDINAGDSAERVVARVEAYLAGLRKVCPDAALVILSTTHAPSRRAKWDEMRRADAGFRRIVAESRGVAFVDINEALNFPGDEPRPGMYLKDDLHPTEAGYAAMLRVIRPAVDAAWKANAAAHSR